MGWPTEAQDGGCYPRVELGGGNSCPGDCGFRVILINEVDIDTVSEYTGPILNIKKAS